MPRVQDHDESNDPFEFVNLSPKDITQEQHDGIYNVDYPLLRPYRRQFTSDVNERMQILRQTHLTKEQVDILEALFQAQPRPDSMAKRRLALQTQLSILRVAVRRA